MLNDASGFKKVYLATGFTDLHKGVDSLVATIVTTFNLNPFDKNTLFLFCGRRSDRIKGLLWERDGFLLLYKRLETGAFSWPRNSSEAMEITEKQYKLLMKGLSVVARKPITNLGTLPVCI